MTRNWLIPSPPPWLGQHLDLEFDLGSFFPEPHPIAVVDHEGQVNNSLAFPGIFRGALDTRARQITDQMKIAAAHAIASSVSDAELSPEMIIPAAMNFAVAPRVAMAVAKVAMETGEARQMVDMATVEARCRAFVYEAAELAPGAERDGAPAAGRRKVDRLAESGVV